MDIADNWVLSIPNFQMQQGAYVQFWGRNTDIESVKQNISTRLSKGN